jgi:hypothetical protein
MIHQDMSWEDSGYPFRHGYVVGVIQLLTHAGGAIV